MTRMLRNILAAAACFLAVSCVQAAPYFQAAGTAMSGTGAVTVAWPTHAVDDIALLFVESAGGQAVTLTTPSGFVAVANSPKFTGAGTAGTRLTVFWARATSTTMASVAVADPGDHVYARILTYRGAIKTGNPWDVTGGGVKTPASTAVTVAGVTTTVADTLVVQAVSRDNDSAAAAFSLQTNANLNNLAERSDAGTTSGNGGGFGVWDGSFTATGATGNTTATVTSSVNAFLTIALKPDAGTGAVLSNPSICSNDASVGSVAWANVNNALVSDDVKSTASNVIRNTTTNYLVCTGFDFSTIPAGATITGITVNVERMTSGGTIRDAFVYLAKDVSGSSVIQTAFNGATATNYTTADVVEAHGGSNPLWNNTWTVAEVQAANFGVAFAARNTSTTSTTNRTVSVDNIQVRISYSPSAFHHASINAPGSAMALSIVPVTIAPHTLTHGPINGAGTISLSTSTGTGDWTVGAGTGTLILGAANSGQASYTFAAGESSATLGFISQSATTLTLNVADGLGLDMLLNTPAGEKANTITFSGASFVFTDSGCSSGVAFGTAGQCAKVAWSPRVAGQPLSNVYITSVDTAGVPAQLHPSQSRTRDLQFGLSCHNPVTNAGVQATFSATVPALPLCQANGAPPTGWTTAVTFTFVAGNPSVGPYDFNYNDVGQVELWLQNANALAEKGSSGAFVVKPAGFVLSEIKPTNNPSGRCSVNTTPAPAVVCGADATGNKFVRAGEAFSVTVKALNNSGNATPNYGKETTAEGVKLATVLKAGLGLIHNPALNGNFAAFSGGVATGTAFNWDEVGVITLSPGVGDGNYLGAGDVTGTASGDVGRFYLDHFDVQNTLIENRAELCKGGVLVSDPGVSCSPNFSYMGEQVDASFTLVPMSQNNVALQNYVDSAVAANDFAKLDPTLFADLNVAAVDIVTSGGPHYLGARISNAGVPLADCATTPCFQYSPPQSDADVTAPFMFTRGASPEAPYTAMEVGIAPQDSDGATVVFNLDTNAVPGNDHALIGTTEVRYGRLKISSAAGSELLPLRLVAVAEYYTAGGWLVSATDSITSLTLAATYNVGTAGTTTPTPAGGALNGGKLGITLSRPGVAGVAMVSPATALGYLPVIPGTATFGVYQGRKEFIYLRESY